MKFKALVFDALSLAYFAALALSSALHPTARAFQHFFQSPVRGFGLVAGLLALGAAAAYPFRRFNVRTLGSSIFSGPVRDATPPPPWYRNLAVIQFLLLFGLTCYVGAVMTQLSLGEMLDADGLAGARRLGLALATPNWAVLPDAILATLQTIYMAFLATVFAIPISFLLSFAAAKNVASRSRLGLVVYGVLRMILNVTRSVEAIVWAIIFGVWVGIGPFAGMLALFVHSIASLTKQYSEIIECVSHGPVEGIQSTGASLVQELWFGIVPQIILPYTSFTIYRWDINVRMATIVGLVGGGGIGTLLNEYQGEALWHEVGCIIVVIAVVVWLMDSASAYLREAIK